MQSCREMNKKSSVILKRNSQQSWQSTVVCVWLFCTALDLYITLCGVLFDFVVLFIVTLVICLPEIKIFFIETWLKFSLCMIYFILCLKIRRHLIAIKKRHKELTIYYFKKPSCAYLIIHENTYIIISWYNKTMTKN